MQVIGAGLPRTATTTQMVVLEQLGFAPCYHMRDLLFAADLSTDQKAQLMQVWKLPKGAVYERATVDRTLLALKTLCGGRPAMEKLLPDAATHQVDVSLSCKMQL